MTATVLAESPAATAVAPVGEDQPATALVLVDESRAPTAAVIDDDRTAVAAPAPVAPAGEFRRGALTMLPLLAGYAPFACLIGVAVATSSDPAAAWSGIWLIFAGTAHLAAIELVDSGAGALVAALSALLINLRLGLFSTTLAPHWSGTGTGSRLVAAATVIDPTWMLASRRFAEQGSAAAGRQYYYGASIMLWFGWAAMVSAGMVAGDFIPPEAGLGLLAPLCLVAMVVPLARSAPAIGCVATAAVAAVVGAGLPAGLGLLVAMPAGVAGAMIGRRVGRRGVSR